VVTGNNDGKIIEDKRAGHVIYSDRLWERPRDTREPSEDRAASAELGVTSSFELFAGLLAMVLVVVGLIGVAPVHMAAFGTIAVGFALLVQGGTLADRWKVAIHIPERERTERVGIGTEVIGGFVGIVLGLLAVVGVSPMVLLPSGALVLGAALLLGGPAQPALAERLPSESPPKWYVTRDAVRASGGVMVMAGVAALVLAILALVGGPIVTLTLVAILCVAAALVVAGGALSARLARRFA